MSWPPSSASNGNQWGSFGTGPGEFYLPKGVSVDQRGIVYVLDFGNHRGQMFTTDGVFVGIFGEGTLYQTSPWFE